MSILFTIMCMQFFNLQAQNPDPIITNLFENAYKTWVLQRNDVGLYRDSKILDGSLDYHPASVANVGVGLVSLCIADAMGWETDAEDQALITLQTVTGKTPGVNLDRNASGYYRHFVDMNTGEQAWDSEYSTIDTDLLALGAMFCKNYFSDNEAIAERVDALWNSIDFTKAIANADEGKIWLSMQANGEGGSGLTSVYNEYMLVAWCAINDINHDTSKAQLLWDNFYGNPKNLPKSNYEGYSVFSDYEGSFLSSFIHQFNYYMCHPFRESEQYMTMYKNSFQADYKWWFNNSAPSFAWGHGAGIDLTGYKANKINDNADLTVSPHIIAGYLPINNSGKIDLIDQYNNNRGVYQMPGDPSQKILWRYSLNSPDWRGNSIQGIDYSTFLYGIASLPEYLGDNFFSTYNVINHDVSARCSAHPVSGTIEAEDWCAMSGVSGSPVGFIHDGDWLRYKIDVAKNGTYNMDVHFSCPKGRSQFQIVVDGNHMSTVKLPATGSWASYQVLSTNVYLTSGTHELEISALTNGFNLDRYEFTLSSEHWVELAFSDFESGFDVWSSGGMDCNWYTGAVHAYQGNGAIAIQDNSGIASSFYLTNALDLSEYGQLKIEFWYKAVSMEYGENFYVEYNDGLTWQVIGSFYNGSNFENNEFNFESISISNSDVNLSSKGRVRFRCNASSDWDDIYIDEVRILGNVSSINRTGRPLNDEKNSLAFRPVVKDHDLVEVYPNPCTADFSIKKIRDLDTEISIQVYSVFGEVVYQSILTKEAEIIVSTQEWAPGMYIIKTNGEKTNMVHKIVVN